MHSPRSFPNLPGGALGWWSKSPLTRWKRFFKRPADMTSPYWEWERSGASLPMSLGCDRNALRRTAHPRSSSYGPGKNLFSHLRHRPYADAGGRAYARAFRLNRPGLPPEKHSAERTQVGGLSRYTQNRPRNGWPAIRASRETTFR